MSPGQMTFVCGDEWIETKVRRRKEKGPRKRAALQKSRCADDQICLRRRYARPTNANPVANKDIVAGSGTTGVLPPPPPTKPVLLGPRLACVAKNADCVPPVD